MRGDGSDKENARTGYAAIGGKTVGTGKDGRRRGGAMEMRPCVGTWSAGGRTPLRASNRARRTKPPPPPLQMIGEDRGTLADMAAGLRAAAGAGGGGPCGGTGGDRKAPAGEPCPGYRHGGDSGPGRGGLDTPRRKLLRDYHDVHGPGNYQASN